MHSSRNRRCEARTPGGGGGGAAAPKGTFGPVRNLSGGNIKKLIMARQLSGSPSVLLVAQPTRGIDVGAARYIHERLVGQRDHGTAVLVISEDLDEVMSLSDRVLVIYEGSIIGSADARSSSRETIGLLMAGVAVGSARLTALVHSGGGELGARRASRMACLPPYHARRPAVERELPLSSRRRDR